MAFTKALQLTAATLAEISTVQGGQWFTRADGTRTQFIGLRAGSIPHFSDAGRGDGFEGRTQRSARAAWHLSKRHGDVVRAVKTAPSSVSDACLGQVARALVG